MRDGHIGCTSTPYIEEVAQRQQTEQEVSSSVARQLGHDRIVRELLRGQRDRSDGRSGKGYVSGTMQLYEEALV